MIIGYPLRVEDGNIYETSGYCLGTFFIEDDKEQQDIIDQLNNKTSNFNSTDKYHYSEFNNALFVCEDNILYMVFGKDGERKCILKFNVRKDDSWMGILVERLNIRNPIYKVGDTVYGYEKTIFIHGNVEEVNIGDCYDKEHNYITHGIFYRVYWKNKHWILSESSLLSEEDGEKRLNDHKLDTQLYHAYAEFERYNSSTILCEYMLYKGIRDNDACEELVEFKKYLDENKDKHNNCFQE